MIKLNVLFDVFWLSDFHNGDDDRMGNCKKVIGLELLFEFATRGELEQKEKGLCDEILQVERHSKLLPAENPLRLRVSRLRITWCLRQLIRFFTKDLPANGLGSPSERIWEKMFRASARISVFSWSKRLMYSLASSI